MLNSCKLAKKYVKYVKNYLIKYFKRKNVIYKIVQLQRLY